MKPDGDHAQFSDPDWLFELEFDGLRTLASVTDGEVGIPTPDWRPRRHPALDPCDGGA